MELRERIAWARSRAKLTQKQLADRVGVSRQAVMQWEQSGGTKTLEAGNAIRAASALRVDALWLATGEGQPVALHAQEEPAAYHPEVPADLAAAWKQLDASSRKHILALIMDLAKAKTK